MKVLNLDTERLHLRQLDQNDLNSFHKIIGTDTVGRNLPKGEAYTLIESKEWIEGIIEHWENFGYGIWGLFEKSSGRLTGYSGLRFFPEMKETEVLYSINPVYWGKGYATEAGKAAIHFGLKTLKLKKIIGLTKMNNSPSQRVLEKIGLVFIEDTKCFNIECKYHMIENS